MSMHGLARLTHRAWLAACILNLTLAFGTGCRKREPPRVEIFDEAATPAQTEALGSLAPPWPAPERVVLANGLLVHWLHEAETPALHLRLILPTHALKPALQGTAALVAARALALELERLSPRLAVRVELQPGLDRLELALHGVVGETDAVLSGLADALSGDPARALAQARRQLLTELRPLDAEALAASELMAILRGDAAVRERIDPALLQTQGLGDSQLLDAWKALTDPRQALLVVHARTRLSEAAGTAGVAELTERWRQQVNLLAGNEARSEPQALLRLRPNKSPPSTTNHLTRAPIAPLRRVDPPGSGRPLLVIGRAIPTATARERSLARLVQRRLQEQFDVRLGIAGPWAALTLHIPLAGLGKAKPAIDLLEGTDPPKDAETEPQDPLTRRLRRELTVIRDVLRLRPTTQDLFQAAQLWLGARMVAASLAGEDWTALWSESLDLAANDGDIAAALARDAQAMLAATPEEVVAWQQRWLDLKTSEPGWAWVLVGQEADLQGVQGFLKAGISFEPAPEN